MKTNLTTYKVMMLVTIFFVSFTSCTKDLDITPQDDQTLLGEDFFANETSYKELLAGVYANLSLTGINGPESSNIIGLDAGTSQFGRTLLYLQTLAADQIIWSYENDGGVAGIQRNNWTDQNPLILGMFSRAHATVAFANNFLRETTSEKLDSRNVSTDVRADIVTYRAEARLLRAMSYYYLIDLFGQANFVTEEDQVNSIPKAANRAELFTYVEAELKAIEADLLDAKTNEHGRADKAVAAMILAKLYLNAEVYIGEAKYDECVVELNKIINAGYSLAPDYLLNFTADNDTNAATNEIIFL